MKARLQFWPQPHVGESVRGFLARVCEENHLRNALWLRYVPTAVQRVRSLVGTVIFGRTPSWICRSASPCVAPKSIHHMYILGERARCCPECLKESQYWSFLWEHVLYTVCHRHSRLMVDVCPDCNSPLSWRRSHLLYCDCGSSIISWGSIKEVSDEEHAVSECLAHVLEKEAGLQIQKKANRLGEVLRRLNAGQLTKLIFLFGVYRHISDKPRTKGNPIVKDVEKAHLLISASGWFLNDWPDNFFEFLREAGHYNTLNVMNYEPPHHYLLFSKAIRRLVRDPAFSFVAKAYKDFVLRNWYGPLTKRSKWLAATDTSMQRYIPSASAESSLHVSRNQIKQLLAAGILNGYVRCTRGEREVIVVERSSLPNAIRYIDDWVTCNGAAELLGISKSRVPELVAAGLLTEIAGISCLGMKARMFSRKEIASLIKRLLCHAREPKKGEDIIATRVVLKMYLASTQERVSLINALLSGEIAPIQQQSKEKGLIALAFNRVEFVNWLQKIRVKACNDCYTIVEAAVHLKLKQEVAYQLVRAGLLPTRIAEFGKRRCRLVDVRDVEHFSSTYVSSVDLASRVGRSPKALVNDLRLKGILPVVGPTTKYCRQYFFRRDNALSSLISS